MAISNKKKFDEKVSKESVKIGKNDGVIFDNSSLYPHWERLINLNKVDAESNLLRITRRKQNIDPLAKSALESVSKEFDTNTDELRQIISEKGWATDLDKVIKRINSLRITDNKRLILSRVYPHILMTLLCSATDEAVEDEIGFTNDVLFELEKANGPLDYFSKEVVIEVAKKHRINIGGEIILPLVAHQVRAGL